MSRTGDPNGPASAWADTQHVAPRADLSAPATQIVGDRDAYLGDQGDVGRRIAEDHVELFVSGDVAAALQREFQSHAAEFVALHDIGASGSLRLLGSLAGSAGARVQRLSVRREGHGLALAVLQFVEVPLADASRLRIYSTDISADAAVRQQVARVLLAHSQLGVLMVGDLPLHAVTNALHPLHEQMTRGLWPNRELLIVPLSGNATLASQGAQLATGSPVAVHVAPPAARPRQVWGYIAGAWNRVQGTPGGRRGLNPDMAGVMTRPAAPASYAETQPMGLDGLEPRFFDALPGAAPTAAMPAAAPPLPAPPPALPGQAAATRPAAPHMPAADLPSGFAQRGSTPRPPLTAAAYGVPPSTAAPAAPTAIQPMPVPGATQWQLYVDRCMGIRGVLSVCVFDIHNLQPLAHAGGAPAADRLAQQGALLMAELIDVARALGFGSTRPDTAISLGTHHLLLQHVPGHPGIALHLVLQATATHLTVARVQLERIEVPA